MTVGFSTARNATSTVAMWKLITQLEKETGIVASHPLIGSMIRESEAYANMKKGINAAAMRTTTVDFGSLTAVATAEGALPAPSTFAIANADHTPSRIAVLLEPTDSEIALFPAMGLLDPVSGTDAMSLSSSEVEMIGALAYAFGKVWINTLIGLLKLIMASLGNTSGVAGTDYTYARLRAAIKLVRLIAKGRGLGLLTGDHGWDPVEDDILSLGGAVQLSAIGQKLVNPGEDSYYTDVYMSTDILRTTGMPAAPGADVYGGVVYPGCLALRANVEATRQGREVIIQTPFWVLYRLGYAGGSVSQYEWVANMGLQIIQSNLGFRILHD